MTHPFKEKVKEKGISTFPEKKGQGSNRCVSSLEAQYIFGRYLFCLPKALRFAKKITAVQLFTIIVDFTFTSRCNTTPVISSLLGYLTMALIDFAMRMGICSKIKVFFRLFFHGKKFDNSKSLWIESLQVPSEVHKSCTMDSITHNFTLIVY